MRDDDRIPILPSDRSENKHFLYRFNQYTWTFKVSLLMVIVYTLTLMTYLLMQQIYVTDQSTRSNTQIYSWSCVLYYWGAKHAPSIRYHYHFHRLVLPALLHGGLLHLLGNLMTQVYYGFLHEQTLGIKRVAMVYIMGGVSGNIFSSIYFKYSISIGASSSIFALLGLEIIIFICQYRNMDRQRFFAFLQIVPLNLYTFFHSGQELDIAGHMGGLVIGLSMGLAYMCEDCGMRKYNDNKYYQSNKLAAICFYGLTASILCLSMSILFTMDLKDNMICYQ